MSYARPWPGVDALSDLARRLVDAVRDSDRTERIDDPFALALDRYLTAGDPPEVEGRWRAALRTRPAGEAAAVAVLRKLDRDLLAGVVRFATGNGRSAVLPDEAGSHEGTSAAGPPDGGDDERPARLRVITDASTLPALVLGPDGAWHAAEGPAAPRSVARGRLASLAGLASRYPAAQVVASERRPLLARMERASASGTEVKSPPET